MGAAGEPFICNDGRQHTWDLAKRTWCCEEQAIGCPHNDFYNSQRKFGSSDPSPSVDQERAPSPLSAALIATSCLALGLATALVCSVAFRCASRSCNQAYAALPETDRQAVTSFSYAAEPLT